MAKFTIIYNSTREASGHQRQNKQRVEVGDSSPFSLFESKEESGVDENRLLFRKLPQLLFLRDDTNLVEDEEDNDLSEFIDFDFDKEVGVLGEAVLKFFRPRILARNGPKESDFEYFGVAGDLKLFEGAGVIGRLRRSSDEFVFFGKPS